MTAGRAYYLDYNASAPLRPEARAAMLETLDVCGNPSSVHAEGRRARAIIERAREQVARLVNATPDEVVFTSGGTEANNLALRANPFPCFDDTTLYYSAIEHPSVLAGGGFEIEKEEVGCSMGVLPSGVVDVAAFQAQLALDFEVAALGHSFVASVMLANNETGVIQPVQEVAAAIEDGYATIQKEARLEWCDLDDRRLFHSDGVQAAGKIPIDLASLCVDLLTISAHKFGGPKGAGALVGRRVRHFEGSALLKGGGQERRRRGGTENVAAIAGFGAAAEAALRDLADMERIEELRDRLEDEVKQITPQAVVVGEDAPRLPNTSCVALPGRKAETMVIALDLAGIAVSAGAACSSGKVGRSHVLDAMGIADDVASSAIRVSLGWDTKDDDIEAFLAAWASIAARKAPRRAAA